MQRLAVVAARPVRLRRAHTVAGVQQVGGGALQVPGLAPSLGGAGPGAGALEGAPGTAEEPGLHEALGGGQELAGTLVHLARGVELAEALVTGSRLAEFLALDVELCGALELTGALEHLRRARCLAQQHVRVGGERGLVGSYVVERGRFQVGGLLEAARGVAVVLGGDELLGGEVEARRLEELLRRGGVVTCREGCCCLLPWRFEQYGEFVLGLPS